MVKQKKKFLVYKTTLIAEEMRIIEFVIINVRFYIKEC